MNIGFITILFAFVISNSAAQQFRNMQDSTLNNLVHPAGYKTCRPGELGGVTKSGVGRKAMILIPGIGFGGNVFNGFMEAYKEEYTMYAITPAGFGGTPAPPLPDTGAGYTKLAWTDGIVTGILGLIEKEKLDKPVIVAHFVTGTQVALNLALDHPDKIGKVIVLSGQPYRYYPGKKDGTYSDWANELKYTADQRARLVQAYWAPRWFRTVTQNTWDQNNWRSAEYTADSAKGNRLVKESSAVPLQVSIRYLIEFFIYDSTSLYGRIKVPILVLMPGFSEQFLNEKFQSPFSAQPVSEEYMKYFHQDSWNSAHGNPMFQFQIIPDARIFMWYDNPKATYEAINNFLRK